MIIFLFIILGALSILYYIGISVYTTNFIGFQLVWALIGSLVLSFGILEGMILHSMQDSTSEPVDYIIILGAQVRGTTITKSLKLRLDTSIAYLEQHTDTTAIVSGGQGPLESISEAAAMKQYLTEHGISASRILMEDRSTNTAENLEFSKKIIEQNSSTYSAAIVSNDFHLCRAKAIARKAGFSNISGIAAPSDSFLLPNYMAREAIALLKYKLCGNL